MKAASVVVVFLTVGVGDARIGGSVALDNASQAARPAVQRFDLAAAMTAGRLRAVNRDMSRLKDRSDAVHVSERADNGVVWIARSDFAEGTIEVDLRGRDVLQQSFLGLAFHGKDDRTYESVYVRPFNFRADDRARRQHAVQYMMLPDYDWPRLRQEFPEKFENRVDASIAPTDWVSLKVVVSGATVEVFVGADKPIALEARKLGQLSRGMVGLWAGNNSDGDFADLRITSMK
jgi:hypothetical protein